MMQDLVRVLQQVPEKRLSIFRLVWEVLDEHGDIDPEKALFKAEEFRLALQEVELTRAENHKLLEALVRWCHDRPPRYP